MKLPTWLTRLTYLNNLLNVQKEENVTKKSAVIEPEATKVAAVAAETNPNTLIESKEYETDDELFDTLQTILENQFVDRDKLDTAIRGIENNGMMLSMLIKLLSGNSGTLGVLDATPEDINDMKIVIISQRKIVTGLLTIPILDSTAREAISKKLVEMPEWEALEAAENRLKEREQNRKVLRELQSTEQEQV